MFFGEFYVVDWTVCVVVEKSFVVVVGLFVVIKLGYVVVARLSGE
ncbi:hypothetical protein MKY37_06335 [Psychrobacillus sp. FSL K6-2836]